MKQAEYKGTAKPALKCIYIASYPPRKCGIATFTDDLTVAINRINPDALTEIIAIDSTQGRYHYPPEVKISIRRDVPEDYRRAAKYINESAADVVNLQHEFGLFGGREGNYILLLIEAINKPVICTFHTLLSDPDEPRKRIMQRLIETSAAVIALTHYSKKKMINVYKASRPDNIVVIYHGVPEFAPDNSLTYKNKLTITASPLILMSGLLGHDKGAEYAIQAMPKIVNAYPNTLLCIIGETHPDLVATEGERYRQSLIDLARDLDMEASVRFVNTFMPLSDLITWFKACDFYVTPHLQKQQSASGTLSKALAAGKVCISTPYDYAQEMLAQDIGILVPFKDADAIAHAIVRTLQDPGFKLTVEKNAYALGQRMQWPKVASEYVNLFGLVRDRMPRPPRDTLTHLKNITDEFGVWQHFEKGTVLRSEGYALDDAARALIVFLKYGETRLAEVCLTYLEKSFKDGLYIGFFDEDKRERVYPSSEDALGLTFWALAFCKQHGFEVERCERLIAKSRVDALLDSHHIRALSYACIAYSLLNDKEKAREAADHIMRAFTPEWAWFEERLTYANAIMPYALMSYRAAFDIKNEALDDIIEQSVNTLEKYMRIGTIPAPVGNRAWQKINDSSRDIYGQQPIDAAYMVLMHTLNFKRTGSERALYNAREWMAWFYGDNIIKQNLINDDFACANGIDEVGMNDNRGAESTIVYLWAEKECKGAGLT